MTNEMKDVDITEVHYYLFSYLRNNSTYSTMASKFIGGEGSMVHAMLDASKKYRTPIIPILWQEITQDDYYRFLAWDKELENFKKPLDRIFGDKK
jgi:hypothetical protein